ncbi:hypothetical protein [Owenweeksia hongkongensis]|uniref:Lipoprotein n=1 Tax=Owenweeksia hongkongensis (strain DSM 17368 / CIP 108786 / JCM 12287 / NRRL B-23963 / UST20020801) TaxID=926562 RepID=G8R472_OWEHD|nr:hypothetical protein [Owenweeksia hongkongensis]AEV33139.1 hypothetical protein Oweho_2165 [Owenweeksia hongkongensis DSM 17368]
MKKIKSIVMFSAFAAAFTLTSCGEDDKQTTTPAVDTELSGVISENKTLTSDKVWYLDGRVTVSGATLTIEPGTVIKANPGAGAISSALVIARDGKIMANGTASEPIIFTTIADDIASGDVISPNMDAENNGLWGGVIILGNAPISASATEVQIEGIPTSDQNGLYGGTEPAHSSGEFTYVSIRHGGTNIGSGNEINGLTLGGVGSGTTIHHIEVVANQDDGIEWFGGTVSVSDVLIWNSGDDGLDTDQDWLGTCENFVVITPNGGSAFELDGPEGPAATGTHWFKNGTVYAGENIDHLVDWDSETNAALENVYFYGLASGYAATADFSPFESFGGDMSGATSNIQVTINGGTLADLFEGSVPTEVTEVAEGANTVGANSGEFAGWTWAAASGELSKIGQ